MSTAPEGLPAGPISIDDAVKLALGHCNFGRLALSDHICARILEADPGHLQALIVRGIAAHKGRDNARALRCLIRAAAVLPFSPDANHHLGLVLLQEGRLAQAGAAFTRALRMSADHAEALAGLAEVHRALGDAETAFALLGRSVALKPNYSPSYVTHSLMCFERSRPAGAPPFPRRARAPGRPLLTMASLASYGRFAHTVHEYLAVRLYAETYGLEFATPDWVGHAFFELDDPAAEAGLQPDFAEWKSQREEFTRGFEQTVDTPFRDRDLFLGGSPVDPFRAVHRERILSWMRPRDCWQPYLEPGAAFLRDLGNTVVAIHIRQTDWWDKAYTPLSLYRSWLEANWSALDRPVLFVSTDEPSVLPEFARYAPVTSAQFPVRWEGLDYLQDFHALMTADVLAISTGGFARTAAALNRRARLFLRPDAGNAALEPFSPWL